MDERLIYLAGLCFDPKTLKTSRTTYSAEYGFPEKSDKDNSRRMHVHTDMLGVGKITVNRLINHRAFDVGPESLLWYNADHPFDLESQVKASLIAKGEDVVFAVNARKNKYRGHGVLRWDMDYKSKKPLWETPMPERIGPRCLIRAGDKLLLVD